MMPTTCSRPRRLRTALGALLMPLSLASMLHGGTMPGDFTTFSMTDKITETVKGVVIPDGDPETPDLPFYEPGSTNTTSISLTAVLGNVDAETFAVTPLDLSEITPDTEFSVNVGGMSWAGTLGQDLTYTDTNKATKRSVFIPVNFHELTGNPVGANGIKLAWTATKLTVSISRSNSDQDDKGSPLADTFLGMDEPGGPSLAIKDRIPISITFGPVSTNEALQPTVAFVSGTASLTTRTMGSGDFAEMFDLNTISLTGALDTAPPAITVKAPTGNLAADDGTATLTGKVTDGHGIFAFESHDVASGVDSFIENTTVVKGPPAEALENWWGPTEWNWTLPLTDLPYGATQLEIRATDIGSNVKTAPVTLFRKLPARYVGRWDALLDADETAQGLPGYLSLMVSQTGGITGSLRLRGMSAAKPVTGFWNGNGLTAYVDKGKPAGFKIQATVANEAELDAAKLALTISVVQGTGEEAPAVALGTGFRVTFDAKNKIAAGSLLIGRFNGYLGRDTLSEPAPSYGHGHFSMVTTNAGINTIAGKVADGTSFTGAGIVGPQGQMPFFISLYSNKGSLHSSPQVDGVTGVVTSRPALWFRPAAMADKQFPAGIDIALSTEAARYTAPLKDQRILSLINANILATWGGDGTAGNVTQNATITPAPANKVTAVGGTAGFNASVDGAKGTIIGTFKLPTTPSVAASYSAVIVGNQVFGFYLAAGDKGATLKRYGFFTLQAAPALD